MIHVHHILFVPKRNTGQSFEVTILDQNQKQQKDNQLVYSIGFFCGEGDFYILYTGRSETCLNWLFRKSASLSAVFGHFGHQGG